MHEPLQGIADADERLGRPFPLPQTPLPLCRWVDVLTVGEGDGTEVAWSLDDSRPGAPGRLALYAGSEPPPARELSGAVSVEAPDGYAWLSAPLDHAEPSLRPVHELSWEAGGLHLRLTAQGPWTREALVAIADSIGIGSGR